MATNSKPEKEEQKLPTYQLPFVEKPATHDELFDVHGDDPLFLRPADMDRLYGMPAATIYELIADQPVTHFPAIKMHLIVILPNLRAVSGAKGIFVELAGKNVKDAKTEKWTHIPHYYVSKEYKKKIEELIIELLSKRG